MRAVERTHDMMALHAMRLVESNSDSLSVVIKPAVGTELSLELRQRNGGVEAQATLTRGDHQFLSQHWPELQQRLEQRGIKLAPLGGETDFSANDNGQFPAAADFQRGRGAAGVGVCGVRVGQRGRRRHGAAGGGSRRLGIVGVKNLFVYEQQCFFGDFAGQRAARRWPTQPRIRRTIPAAR